MRIRPIFAWYDFWVGWYWDRKLRRLYVLPLPCIGVMFDFDPLPELNARRHELIDKKWQGGLSEAESAELTRLQDRVFAILESRDPRPVDDVEARLNRLDVIEARLKGK